MFFTQRSAVANSVPDTQPQLSKPLKANDLPPRRRSGVRCVDGEPLDRSVRAQRVPGIRSRRVARGNQACRQADNCYDGQHARDDRRVPRADPE
jgi:hypothetical protein